MRRWLPSPPLSITLLVVWILLNQSLHLTTWLSGLLLAVAVPLLTRSLRPASVRMRRPGVALRLALHVLADMSQSVFTVARLLLTRRVASLEPHFVRIELRARDPNVLAALAVIMCLTPGTAWCELSAPSPASRLAPQGDERELGAARRSPESRDGAVLLVHLFHQEDEAAFITMFRDRYETPLMEIFES